MRQREARVVPHSHLERLDGGHPLRTRLPVSTDEVVAFRRLRGELAASLDDLASTALLATDKPVLTLPLRIELRQFLFLLTGLALALHSVRNLSFFVLVAVPALADYTQQVRERFSWRWPLRVPRTSGVTFAMNLLMILTLSAVVALASVPSLVQRIDGKLVARDFPIKAADFLVAHPAPGHMLNAYGWGGYLIFRLYGHQPAQPVFIFGDAALSGDALLRDYDHLQSLGSDQAQLLDHYQINWVIFHSGDPIITELRQDHSAPGHVGWFELRTFDKATIMMRDTPDNRAYAAQAGG